MYYEFLENLNFFNKLAKNIGKKYKETYRLSMEQALSLNKGYMIVYYDCLLILMY